MEHVYVGPGRTGFLDVLRRMGAAVEVSTVDPGTMTASVTAGLRAAAGDDVGGAEVPGLIDEIPILAVAAAYAEGITSFADAAELRVKESDRIATMVAALSAVGVRVESRPDGLVVHGGGGAKSAGQSASAGGSRADSSARDHRVAMALAVAGLAARARSASPAGTRCAPVIPVSRRITSGA